MSGFEALEERAEQELAAARRLPVDPSPPGGGAPAPEALTAPGPRSFCWSTSNDRKIQDRRPFSWGRPKRDGSGVRARLEGERRLVAVFGAPNGRLMGALGFHAGQGHASYRKMIEETRHGSRTPSNRATRRVGPRRKIRPPAAPLLDTLLRSSWFVSGFCYFRADWAPMLPVLPS